MRSGNPALNSKTFEDIRPATGNEEMTLGGTVNKTGILLLLLVAAASFTWEQTAENPALVTTWALVGGLGGFVMAMITVFKKHFAPITAPIYAGLEGLFLGSISVLFERMYPGIVIQAVALTFGTLFALLLAYKSGLIRATENFKLGVVAATGSVFMFYIATWIMSMFGVSTDFMRGSGLLSIGISGVVVVIAALNLVLDFDFIEEGSERGLPKYMEWYGAFGLMVTLIWLYVEILHLLSKLRSR
jgi:uncharacterized YccA/Bax inhibitor family protein